MAAAAPNDHEAVPNSYVEIRRWRPQGKPPARSIVEKKLRAKQKERGMVVSSTDEELTEDETGLNEKGATVLYGGLSRSVVRCADNTVIKSGRGVSLEEADAMRVAWDAGVPVPRVYGAETTSNGIKRIRMGYVEGTTLDKLWGDLSEAEKTSFIEQLRAIVVKMRSTPPPRFIGGCAGREIRDTRYRFTYSAPVCQDEKAFNDYLLSAVERLAPVPVKKAFARRLRTDHRVVFSHCDLAPRNMIVREGKIVALIDWEEAGWYPEYWEYVKFFCRPTGVSKDWEDRADEIFPQIYPDELGDHMARDKWQTD